MKKLFTILAVVAFAATITSCHKVTDCKCTTTYTKAGLDTDVDFYSGVSQKGGSSACWSYEQNVYQTWDDDATDYGTIIGETTCEKL